MKLVQLTDNNYIKKLIPPNYTYQSGKLRQVNRDGLTLELDLSKVVDHHLFWESQLIELKYVVEYIKRARTILDIGGNIGGRALLFASLNPKARVVSFEPHPANFKRAQQNISHNNYEIYLVKSGLGAKKEQLRMYEVNESNPGMNRIISGEHNYPFTIIEIDTLDSFCKQLNLTDIDFVKIDVEGFAYQVMEGASDMIARHKPVFLIELDDDDMRKNNHTARQLIELLVKAGYTRFVHSDTFEMVDLNSDFEHCHFDIIATA
ncbi:MAG: FkbM family methyltransferase [Bacteroidetes bacterium]|nr:FkbM family methyltransferase [Bacteroidota bacterium]